MALIAYWACRLCWSDAVIAAELGTSKSNVSNRLQLLKKAANELFEKCVTTHFEKKRRPAARMVTGPLSDNACRELGRTVTKYRHMKTTLSETGTRSS
jgi:hypothetical protein